MSLLAVAIENTSELCKSILNHLNVQLNDGKYSTKFLLFGSLVVVATTSSIFKWLRMLRYFRKMNISGPTPLPLVGNLMDTVKSGFDAYDEEMHKKYGGVCGYFEGDIPVILITDAQMIKAITVKDAAFFYNRRRLEALQVEPFKSFLTSLVDDEWRNVRSIITTSFTSAKLKEMSKLIMKCSNALNDYLGRLADENAKFDVKQVFGSFTFDVISTCLFGVETNAIGDPENIFFKHVKNFIVTLSPKMFFLFMFPTFAEYLARKGYFNVLPADSTQYFSRLTNEIIERRRKGIEVRNDFIQNMIDHNKENSTQQQQDQSKKKSFLTDKEILSQAILFFIAGFDTTATTISLLAYNLVKHPECQTKLIDEVDEMLKKNGGQINYETVNELKYLDQCINETLRLYPPALRTDRECSQDYQYDNNGVVVRIPKGQVVNICIWAVHHDPEIYPEPDKFDPERFSDEEKSARDPAHFIPFGVGQHICVGQRFALIEMKLFLTEFLSKMYFVACEQTPSKLTLAKGLIIRTNETIYVKAKKRF